MEKKIFKNKKINNHEDYPPETSYVIFESEMVRHRVLQDYGKYARITEYFRYFCFCFSCFISSTFFYSKKNKILHKHKIEVLKPDKPSNITWNNTDYSNARRFWGKTLSFILLIVSFLALYGLNITKNYGNANCYDNNMTLEVLESTAA